MRHLAGSSNVPSDFASRNAATCNDPVCLICSFIRQLEECVVQILCTSDVTNSDVKLLLTSRAAWLSIQSECQDLRRTQAQLVQGTRPSKKLTEIRDVKRYINIATVSRDGLLVVKRDSSLSTTRECIIVPRQVLRGLLTALHIHSDHPTSHQLKLVVRRFVYALDMDKSIEEVNSKCHQCVSLRNDAPPTPCR